MSMPRVQMLAVNALQLVEGGRNLTQVLTDIFVQNKDLTKQQKGALQDIAFGTQRYLGCLKFYLRHLVPKVLPASEIEALIIVALYQLVYSKNAQHAVVDGAVNAASQMAKGNFKGLVNGVLRTFLRQQEKIQALAQQDEVAKYNHPKWWVNYLKEHYPKYWHNILVANQSHPPMTLRVNHQKISTEAYCELLKEQGMGVKVLAEAAIKLDTPVSVEQLPNFFEGYVSVQDFGAQQAALILAPKDGERILDACAAPGGKTGHLLEMARCDVTALDIDEMRLKRVFENLERLGFQAATVCADATQLNTWFDGQLFDAVLADVPCSASGIVRRHPDIKWLRQSNDANKLAKQQEILLDALWGTLKQNGRMLLATCSVFFEENTQQLESFLLRHADAHLLMQQTLLPSERTDGFYYALIQKH